MRAVRWSSVAAVSVLVAAASLARPRPCAAQTHTASARNVTLRMTLPEGLPKVKGIFAFTVRGLASGWASGTPFKELAKRLDSVIVTVSGGDDLNDPSYPNRCASGEFNGLGEALTKLAMASNHPEIANAPVVGIGHSHGGDWWNWYNACHPEKMALVFVHASGGVNYSAASLEVPVFYELGTGDLIENGSKKPRAGMFVNRAKGAPMSLVIGQGEGHNNVTAESLGMIIDLIEATFKLRVPPDADGAAGPIKLRKIDETMGGYWLGNLYTKEIAPYNQYQGNKALTSFLPNEEIAKKWKATGPGLPTSIVLPADTCGWCGNPKDEPKASPGEPAPPGTSADAGAPPTPADAAAVVPPSPDAGGGMTAPPPVKRDAAPVTTDPPAEDPDAGEAPVAQRSSGCAVGGESSGSWLVLLALLLWRRRSPR